MYFRWFKELSDNTERSKTDYASPDDSEHYLCFLKRSWLSLRLSHGSIAPTISAAQVTTPQIVPMIINIYRYSAIIVSQALSTVERHSVTNDSKNGWITEASDLNAITGLRRTYEA